MSCANVKIRLANSLRPDLSPVEAEAAVDSDRLYLLLPVRLAARLKLKANSTRTIPGEYGGYEICPYVGPLELQLGSQSCFTGAVISGSRVRIGSMALAAMNLVVRPDASVVENERADPSRQAAVFVQGKL